MRNVHSDGLTVSKLVVVNQQWLEWQAAVRDCASQPQTGTSRPDSRPLPDIAHTRERLNEAKTEFDKLVGDEPYVRNKPIREVNIPNFILVVDRIEDDLQEIQIILKEESELKQYRKS